VRSRSQQLILFSLGGKAVHRVVAEIMQRFPELASKIAAGDEDLPYTVMSDVTRWLKTVPPRDLPAALGRLRSFVAWCEQQPRSDDPG